MWCTACGGCSSRRDIRAYVCLCVVWWDGCSQVPQMRAPRSMVSSDADTIRRRSIDHLLRVLRQKMQTQVERSVINLGGLTGTARTHCCVRTEQGYSVRDIHHRSRHSTCTSYSLWSIYPRHAHTQHIRPVALCHCTRRARPSARGLSGVGSFVRCLSHCDHTALQWTAH